MKIGYLIGALKTGGSERQLSELAVGMVARGHGVEVACYDGPGTFDGFVEAGGARIRWTGGRSKLEKLMGIRAWIAESRPDILHGFMKRASSLAVLGNLPLRRCKVIASDYSTASYARHKWDLWASLALWSLADRVATQTEMNRRNLCLLAPWIRSKVVIVRNGVEITRFVPPERRAAGPAYRFLVVGTVYRVKNPVGLVEAVRILKAETAEQFVVRWVGPTSHGGVDTEEYRTAANLVRRYGLSDVVSFAGPAARMEEEYRWADCLVHVSLQEGMPNAVVEAMACGLPIVVSGVSDLPLLVRAASNGFVCEETRPASIAAAMGGAMRLPWQERVAMGERSRKLAEEWFGRARFLDAYEGIYRELVPGAI
ncbi:MAG: glycosyltransferase family 4 protein [Deltaproteobacteria bacterium]|nr:glycosyltransferase family 4 protein [Deltaproteobacteria bacterium]